MRRHFAILMAAAAIAGVVALLSTGRAFAAASEPADQRIDPAPCVAAVTANDDDQIVAICRRDGVKQAIPLLDLPVPEPGPDGAEWIEAYRRWLA